MTNKIQLLRNVIFISNFNFTFNLGKQEPLCCVKTKSTRLACMRAVFLARARMTRKLNGAGSAHHPLRLHLHPNHDLDRYAEGISKDAQATKLRRLFGRLKLTKIP